MRGGGENVIRRGSARTVNPSGISTSMTPESSSRAELVEIAKRVSKPMADALSQPPPSQTVWVFVFTIFGPTVVALAYDSDAPLPSFGDA